MGNNGEINKSVYYRILTGAFFFFFSVVRATHTQEVLGEQGRRIRELTSLIQKRFRFPENSVSLYAAKVQNRGLSAVAQCESLRYKLLNGLAVRRACYGVLRFIMESGAKGCEVVVSGKLRAARAKSMKFTVCFFRLGIEYLGYFREAGKTKTRQLIHKI